MKWLRSRPEAESTGNDVAKSRGAPTPVDSAYALNATAHAAGNVPDANQLFRRQRIRPATWSEIFKSGMNVDMVVADSVSMVFHCLGWLTAFIVFLMIVFQVQFWSKVAPLYLEILGDKNYSVAAFQRLLSQQIEKASISSLLVLSLAALFVLCRLYSTLFRKWFAICRCSAMGMKATHDVDEQHGLWYAVVLGIQIAVCVLLPLLALGGGLVLAVNRGILPPPSQWEESTLRTTPVVIAGIAAFLVLLWTSWYPSMALVVAVVGGSRNPLTVAKWIWKCGVGYLATMWLYGLWSVALTLLFGLFVAGTGLTTWLIIDHNWPELAEPMRTAIVGGVSSDGLTADVVQLGKRELSLQQVPPGGAVVIILLSTGMIAVASLYFGLHLFFLQARMLGLLACRYRDRLRWCD